MKKRHQVTPGHVRRGQILLAILLCLNLAATAAVYANLPSASAPSESMPIEATSIEEAPQDSPQLPPRATDSEPTPSQDACHANYTLATGECT